MPANTKSKPKPRPTRVAAAQKRAANVTPSGIGRIMSHRVPSDEVQGPGSWVDIRVGTWGEAKAERLYTREELLANPDLLREQAERVNDKVAEMIVGWNWLDSDGQPLPLPAGNPSFVDELTAPEVTFLTQAIRKLQDGIKN